MLLAYTAVSIYMQTSYGIASGIFKSKEVRWEGDQALGAPVLSRSHDPWVIAGQ